MRSPPSRNPRHRPSPNPRRNNPPMSAKLNRTLHGPSWTEVIFGALLSVILGAVLGAALMIARPVVSVRQPPKEAERDPKDVYYIQGARDPSKSRAALAKRKSFGEGQSVSFTEDELNALAALPPAAVANPGAEGQNPPAPAKAADSGETIAAGQFNFRLRDGRMQVAVPVTLNVLGLSQQVIVQAHGGFVKEGSGFAFVPETLYVGSMPVQRLPMAERYVREQFLAPKAIPDDVRASWAKLTNVSIDGNTLKLTLP